MGIFFLHFITISVLDNITFTLYKFISDKLFTERFVYFHNENQEQDSTCHLPMFAIHYGCFKFMAAAPSESN